MSKQTEVLQSAFIELEKDAIVTMLPNSSMEQSGYATVDEATAVFRKMAEAMQAQARLLYCLDKAANPDGSVMALPLKVGFNSAIIESR